MALQIKDDTVLRQIEMLSRKRRVSKADVIRSALQHEIEREESQLSARERLTPLLARLDALGPSTPTTPEEDKAFFDEMWGE